MFGRAPFLNPYEQAFGGYPIHQLQQQPFGPSPFQGGLHGGVNPFAQQFGGFGASPWPGAGFGPISPLLPQQIGVPYAQQGSPFGFGQQQPITPLMQMLGGGQYGSPFAQSPYGQSPFGIGQGIGQTTNPAQLGGLMGAQGGHLGAAGFGAAGFGAAGLGTPFSQQRDPRAELLASAIAEITATRDPRVEYLAQVATSPVVATNPVLKDIVAKELLATALQQVALKQSVKPDLLGQAFFRGGETTGVGQWVDPYTAATVKSQLLAELVNPQLAQQKGGLWGMNQGVTGGISPSIPQFSAGTQNVI